MSRVDLVPAIEGHPAHLAPERAGRKRFIAPAPLVAGDPTLPHVDDFPSRAYARQFTEQPLGQGAAAPAQPTEVDDAYGRAGTRIHRPCALSTIASGPTRVTADTPA